MALHLLDMAVALVWHLRNLFSTATDAFYQVIALSSGHIVLSIIHDL